MSFEAMTWASRQRGLKPSTKIVLYMLANEADGDGVSFTGQTKLAWKCEITDRSLRTQLKELELRSLIHRERRPAAWAHGGRKMDAIVLHLEVPGSTDVYPGIAQELAERAENRKRFEAPFSPSEAEISPSQTQPEKFSGYPATRDVSPSQQQPEDFSGKATLTGNSGQSNRKNCAVEPENLGTDAYGALKGSRGRINPQSVPQSVPEQTRHLAAVSETGLTDGPTDQKNSAVVEDVILDQLREGIPADLAGVPDVVLGEMVRVVMSRTSATVRSPRRFVAKAITAEPESLLAIALARIEATEQAETQAALDYPQEQAQMPRREQVCPVHKLSYARICPSCAADAKAGSAQSREEARADTEAGQAFREQIRQRRIEGTA